LSELEPIIELIGAVARQWLSDAKHDAGELQELAEWLGMPPDRLSVLAARRAYTPRRAGRRASSEVHCESKHRAPAR